MKSTGDAYPKSSKTLNALRAILAVGLLSTACTAQGGYDSPPPAVASSSVYPNTEANAGDKAINAEVQATAKCLASKILDLSTRAIADPGVISEIDSVGTESDVFVQIPFGVTSDGDPAVAILSATMGIGINGLAELCRYPSLRRQRSRRHE